MNGEKQVIILHGKGAPTAPSVVPTDGDRLWVYKIPLHDGKILLLHLGREGVDALRVMLMQELKDHAKLVIFDLDNTLVDHANNRPFRKHPGDWALIDGRREAIERLQAKGVKIGIASNQGGVAWGYLPQDGMERNMAILVDDLGLDEEMCFQAFMHPQAKLPQYAYDEHFDRQDDWTDPRTWRKPSPGMLHLIMEYAGVAPEDTLLVGDRPEDEEAAKRAGVTFMHSDRFFEDTSHVVADSIEEGVGSFEDIPYA